MGSGISHAISFKKEGMTEEDIIKLVLPSYYTTEKLSGEELSEVCNSWELIVHNKSPHFAMCRTESGKSFHHESCMDLFYYTMYVRLLDLHPDSKDFFEPPPPGQGRNFVHYMQVLLAEIHEDIKWNETLINLTITHSRMGVKAMEYGVLGDIFIHAVRECVGPHVFNKTTHDGWVKVWSKILSIMVPVAVKFELDADNVLLRDDDSNSSYKNTYKHAEGKDDGQTHFHGVRRAARMFGHSAHEKADSK